MRRRKLGLKPSQNIMTMEEIMEGIERPKEWNIINSINYILRVSEDSELKPELWQICREPLDYLNKQLGLTDIQIVFLSILLEEGEAMSWKAIGQYLNCTRLSLMAYTEEIERLVKKGWIMKHAARGFGGRSQGFKAVYGVMTELRHNRCFQPPKLDNMSLQDFMDTLESHLEKSWNNPDLQFEDDLEWLLDFVEKNPGLEICKALEEIENSYEKVIFLLCLADYAQYDDPDVGVKFNDIDNVMPMEPETGRIRHKLRNGEGPLFRNRLIEHKCEDGIANQNCYCLTLQVRKEMLRGYVPSRSKCRGKKTTDSMLYSYTQIKEKPMFYNSSEETSISRLNDLLKEENYEGVVRRLEERGMRKGFTVILYGGPGTGKTESVLQLARRTGRDIMLVEIAGLRDKWVGQSEKNIKSVFYRYKELCKNCEKAPILFFNEADAIFGSRMEKAQHAVDKMNNSIQNIILQEMEDFEGILIATTNLTGSLDSAFERRFLFKIEFHQPSKDVKAKIWKSMLGDEALAEEDLERIAERYDFSGGQIENIVRKQTIDYILSGEELGYDRLCRYCDEERLNASSHKTVGFNC